MKRKLLVYFFLFIIITSFIALRIHTFYLSHYNTDELIYVSLAAKLDQSGLAAFNGQYNLYYLDVSQEDYSLIIFPANERYANLTRLITGYPKRRVESLFVSHHPPMLSYFLMLAHKLFRPDQPYALNYKQAGIKGLAWQFSACLVPFLFSLLLVLLIYRLGKMLFSKEIGALAALLMVFVPVDMLTAQKIWADDLLSFFSTLTVILYLLAVKKDNLIYAALAGITGALGFLTKQSALLMILVIAAIHFIFRQKDSASPFKSLFTKQLIFFIFMFSVCIFPWVNVFIKYNGLSIFLSQFLPPRNAIQDFPTPFLRLVNSRPWYTYLLSLPFQQPLLLLGYFSIFYFPRDKANRKNLLVLLSWFLIFLICASLMQDKEERYMLPAYPAITILSSYVFLRLWSLFRAKPGLNAHLWQAALIFLLIFSLALAVKIGLPHVFARACLIAMPI